MMTANDINKVDKAIKHRPSRFDYVTEIGNPSYESRVKILETFGMNGFCKRIASLTDKQSAAVLCEIAKRPGLDEANLEEEVKKIIDSFEEPLAPAATSRQSEIACNGAALANG